MKMEMKPRAVYTQILFIDVPNPFVKRKTDSGLFIPQGLAQTNETGDVEQMDRMIGFGIVQAVGDKCEYVKEGDAIFYQRASVRPLPFSEVLFNCPEQGLVGYIPASEVDFEALQAKIEEEERAAMAATAQRVANENKAQLERLEREWEAKAKAGTLNNSSPLIKIN